jgi:hypothetical protein
MKEADLNGIYFVQAEESRAIKIGKTYSGITNRVHQIQTGNHEKVSVIWLYRGSRWTEKSIHEALKEHLIMNEWFECHPNIFYFMKEELYNEREFYWKGQKFNTKHIYPGDVHLTVTTVEKLKCKITLQGVENGI